MQPPTRVGSTDFEPVAEASWLAAPHIHRLPQRTLLLHQVREPTAVAASLLSLQLLRRKTPAWQRLAYATSRVVRRSTTVADPRFSHYIAQHSPECFEARSEVGRALKYWEAWNSMIEQQGASRGANYLRYKIEDMSVGLILEFAERAGLPVDASYAETVLNRLPRSINHKATYNQRAASARIQSVPQALERIRPMARRYGYSSVLLETTPEAD